MFNSLQELLTMTASVASIVAPLASVTKAHQSTRMAGVRVFVWGSGGAGQLGLGNRDDFARPQELHYTQTQLAPESIVTGGCHSAALSEAGELFAWGDNEKLQLARSATQECVLVPEPLNTQHLPGVDIVACGWTHTVVSSADGAPRRLMSWGANEHHQLGRHSTDEESGGVLNAIPFPMVTESRRVVSISCGWKHSLICLDDGSVFAWGSGRHGELGLGKSQLSSANPTKVTALEGHCIRTVLCGWQHSLFHGDGSVFTCGNNRHGQLGVPRAEESARFEPQQVLLGTDPVTPLNATQLDCGWHFVMCVTVAGELLVWGKGAHGQLGLGFIESADRPTQVEFDGEIGSLACGSEHSLVVTTGGDLYTCGWGEHGNLGHGNKENKGKLTLVEFFKSQAMIVTSVTAGGAVSIALAQAHSQLIALS